MSVASHYAVGYGWGWLWRFAPLRWKEARAIRLDEWGWAREVRQHDPTLSPHQQAEALAWGDGFRVAANLPPRGEKA